MAANAHRFERMSIGAIAHGIGGSCTCEDLAVLSPFSPLCAREKGAQIALDVRLCLAPRPQTGPL